MRDDVEMVTSRLCHPATLFAQSQSQPHKHKHKHKLMPSRGPLTNELRCMSSICGLFAWRCKCSFHDLDVADNQNRNRNRNRNYLLECVHCLEGMLRRGWFRGGVLECSSIMTVASVNDWRPTPYFLTMWMDLSGLDDGAGRGKVEYLLEPNSIMVKQ